MAARVRNRSQALEDDNDRADGDAVADELEALDTEATIIEKCASAVRGLLPSVSEERCCYGCNDPATVVRGAFAFCDSCDPNGKPVATPDPISDDGGWNDATRANRAAAFPASDADYDYREHLGEDDGG